MNAGDYLERACGNSMHGRSSAWSTILRYATDEFDPQCQTCAVRAMLAEHNHLHLGGEKCETLGINDVPGENVQCSCGSYHH